MIEGLWAAFRLRTVVRSYALRVLDSLGHAPLGSRLGTGTRTTAIGPDPIRLVVFGAGLAIGYGVTSREHAFDGPLCRYLCESSGFGVLIENRAVRHLATEDAVASLGTTGTHTFDAAIWCPAFDAGLRRVSRQAWLHDVATLVREFRVVSDVPLVLTHMPIPEGKHPATLIARPWVRQINQAIDLVASRNAQVSTVQTEPFVPGSIGEPITDRAYFEAVARHIAPAVMTALRLPVAGPTG